MELHTVFFRGKYRRNEADIFFFFLCAFFVSKSIGNNIFFITNGFTNIITNGFTDGQKITDERYFTDRAFPSVISLVN